MKSNDEQEKISVRCVVLGGTGFIGMPLCEGLAAKGYEVIAFGRRDESAVTFKSTNIRYVQGDFSDFDSLNEVVKNADYVFHFASSSTPSSSDDDPFTEMDTNVRSTLGLLTACVNSGVKKIIFSSSGGAMYGDNHNHARKSSESDVLLPTSPYAIGKTTIEHYLRYYKQKYDLDYVTFRISNVYGAGQHSKANFGIIPTFMESLLNDKPISVYGDGSMTRDYIYISDVVSIIVNNFNSPALTDNTYNLGSGVGHSISDVINLIESISGKKFIKEYIPAAKTSVHTSVLDIGRLTKVAKSHNLVSFEDGLKNTYNYTRLQKS